MRTITIAAHKRYGYLLACLTAVRNNLLKEKFFDTLVISVDHSGDTRVVDLAKTFCHSVAERGLINPELQVSRVNLGIAENTGRALQAAFEENNSDFNLHLEDDAVVTEDALHLIKQFYEEDCHPFSEYALLSLCNHRDYGRGQQSAVPNDPSLLAEASYISSPFAWVTTRWQWPAIRSSWNSKVIPPTGWDFSLSYNMRLLQQKAIHPVVSRCQNIGKYGGANETPETFEATQMGIVYSHNFSGDFWIGPWIPYKELLNLDDWMLPEHKRRFL